MRELERIIIGADHAGYALKAALKAHLEGKGYVVEDVGTYSDDSTDYPVYAIKLGEMVAHSKLKNLLGILVCGTGIGMSITANKVQGIRAAVCTSIDEAEMARLHNDAK